MFGFFSSLQNKRCQARKSAVYVKKNVFYVISIPFDK